jgi:hypothetical protein
MTLENSPTSHQGGLQKMAIRTPKRQTLMSRVFMGQMVSHSIGQFGATPYIRPVSKGVDDRLSEPEAQLIQATAML